VTNLTLAKEGEELAARDEVHDHVQVLRVLKRPPQVDQERVSYSLEHLTFRVGVLDLLHLDNALLRENLDRIRAVVVLRTDEMDTTEGTGTEGADEGEVAESVARRGFAGHGGSVGWGGGKDSNLRRRLRCARDLSRRLRLVAVTVLLLLLLLRSLSRRGRGLLPLVVTMPALLLRRVVVSRSIHLDVVDAHLISSARQAKVPHLSLNLPLVTVTVLLVIPRRVLLLRRRLLLVAVLVSASSVRLRWSRGGAGRAVTGLGAVGLGRSGVVVRV
jgi:hypothetical protein